MGSVVQPAGRELGPGARAQAGGDRAGKVAALEAGRRAEGA